MQAGQAPRVEKPWRQRLPKKLRKQHIFGSNTLYFLQGTRKNRGKGGCQQAKVLLGQGAGPWLQLISGPKHTFSWKVTAVAARTPPGRALLSGQGSANAETAETHPQPRAAASLPPKSTVQGVLRQGCFHPTWEQRKQVANRIKNPSVIVQRARGLAWVNAKGSRKASKHQAGARADCRCCCSPPTALQPGTSQQFALL